MPIQKEPFHWDVMLVQSTQTIDKPVHTSDATDPVVSKPTEHGPMPPRAVRAIPHATASADRIVPIEPQTAEQVAPTSHPRIASPVAPPKEPSTVSISDRLTPTQPQASDPLPKEADIPASSTTTELSTSQTAAATANETSAPPSEAAQPSPSPAAPEAAATPQMDYGWLQQAIFKRLDELKRSSHPSLDESRPLKVMVKALVSREGTLLDSVIVKSSGLDRLDQEAMALIQRAFPMQFDRTLDRQQIVMRIPITYSRE